MDDNNLEDRKILEEFIVDNKDLEQLEEWISQFNIFEAVGAVRQELRHSDFLAYLLNPNENHGLNEEFLKRILQNYVLSAGEFSLSAVLIDTAEFNDVEIRREWRNIDILVIIDELNLVCAIENKIGTKEHSGQLTRYKKILSEEFKKYNQLLIYLTPEGDDPSDENWQASDYKIITEVLQKSLDFKKSSLSEPILILINHYITMLDRHIMSDSNIAELCRKIYSKHKKAIDLINDHKQDLQQEIRIYLESLIKEERRYDFVLDHCSKSYIRFAPKEWDNYAVQKSGGGWTRSKRLLLFEFRNTTDSLNLYLIIGPGDKENREKIYACTKNKTAIFKRSIKKLTDKFSQIYGVKILEKKIYEEPSIEEIYKKIDYYWNKFIEDDYPKLINAIKW